MIIGIILMLIGGIVLGDLLGNNNIPMTLKNVVWVITFIAMMIGGFAIAFR